MGVLSTTVDSPPLVSEAVETDRYELVIFNSAGDQVLLQEVEAYRCLPAVHVPRFTRPAEQITSLLRSSWNVRSILLWSGQMESESGGNSFAVLEAIDGEEQLRGELRWFALPEAAAHIAPARASLIQNSQSKALRMCFGLDPEPFSRLGWFDRITHWINGCIHSSGSRVRDFAQFNGCETFSLVKFETNAEPVWFKAVGEPNLREFSITQRLSQLFPDYLPKVMACDPLVHGWLMADAGAVSLNDNQDPSAWHGTLRSLAQLQIDSMDKTDELLKAGCRDLRLPTLLQLVDPFLDTMADLMLQQPKLPPPILTRQDLSALSVTLKYALHWLSDLQIPNTLGHRDFNPGNIFIGPERCKFIDWAEAFVGPPFLTFEYFIAHLKNMPSRAIEHKRSLREAYTLPWLKFISSRSVASALSLSPLIGVYAYAAGGSSWSDKKTLARPGVAGYLRSLTRRMKQEADLLRGSRVECPS